MIDWTKPIRVRDRKAPAEFVMRLNNPKWPIGIKYVNATGAEALIAITEDGKLASWSGEPYVENIPDGSELRDKIAKTIYDKNSEQLATQYRTPWEDYSLKKWFTDLADKILDLVNKEGI